MRLRTVLSFCLALLIAPAARADGPKDPLRFVPKHVDFVAKIERPRMLVEAVETHELVQEALKIAGVRELYDSTNFRRLYQIIAHFEKEFGQNRNELLDSLTGGGVVVAGKFANPAAAVLIVQPRDEKALRKFIATSLALAEKELARLEVKEPIRKATYEGIPAYRFGPVKGAVVDGALLLATDDKVLHAIIESHLGKKPAEQITSNPGFNAGRKNIPAGAHAWAWLNLAAVRELPGYKTGFEASTQDPFQITLFGGIIDIVRRSQYVTASLSQEKNNWRLSVRTPCGTGSMGGIAKMVAPQGDPGTLPLLQPPRTFASISYFMDLGEFWKNRATIFNDKQAAEFDKVEKESAKFLGGVKLGTLLQQMGNHTRVVFASPEKSPYKTVPTTKIPSFGVVIDMRDPAFGKSMNFILRGIALIGNFTVTSGMKMTEEEHAGCKMVCYRFSETKAYDGDPNGVRFNFDPCFAVVGDQLMMSSTVELGKDLIDELKRGTKEKPQPETMRTKLYGTGAALTFRNNEEQVMTQLILSQALPPGAAREEVRKIIALVERFGTLSFEATYGKSDFRFDVKWQASTK